MLSLITEGRLVNRYVAAVILAAFCLVGTAGAEESRETLIAHAREAIKVPDGLPFWEIGLSDFEADVPQAMSIPQLEGSLRYFWYWTFRFKGRTNLHRVRDFLAENVDSIDNADEKEIVQKQLDLVKKSIANIDKTRLFITLLSEKGDAIPGLSNSALRNAVQKRLGRKLMTIDEIAEVKLTPETEIEGVAIFPYIPTGERLFEIRVLGLGRRFVPTYEPGSLLYLNNSNVSSVRRALRFSYHRIGNSAESYLNPIRLKSRKADWVWMWSTQIFAQRFRELEIERASGLKRQYRYIPYKIVNTTPWPQDIEVLTAGLNPTVKWRGESISIPMVDDGGADDFWKTKAMRMIHARVEDGTETTFVKSYEEFTDPDQEPSEEVKKRIAEDNKAKAEILPDNDQRIFRGTIAPYKRVKGIVILRWGAEDLNKIIDTLLASIRAKAIADVESESELLAMYNELRPKPAEGASFYMRGPEPSRKALVAKLLEFAKQDIDARSLTISDDDKQRYGDLAPIGTVLNALAAEVVNERAAEDRYIVDVAFKVKVGGVIESASFPSLFKDFLPAPPKPFEKPKINVLGSEGTSSTPKTSNGDTGDGDSTSDGDTEEEEEEVPDDW